MITVKEISNNQNGLTFGFSDISKCAQASGYMLNSFLSSYLKSEHFANTIPENRLLIRSKLSSGLYQSLYSELAANQTSRICVFSAQRYLIYISR
jgi:hypothetical protein